MRIELVGTDCPVLPGVTVGVQRGTAVVDERAAEGGTLIWSLDVGRTADGDLAGPFVHGRRGARFLYLVWSRPPDGMFRRAKLMLDDLPPAALNDDGPGIRGDLRLRMADGSPVCAAVRGPALTWSAV